MPCSHEQQVGEPLVRERVDRPPAAGRSTSAGPSTSLRPREHAVVEVGERDDQRGCRAPRTSSCQRRHVGRVVDARHEGVRVGVVERRCERVPRRWQSVRAPARRNAVTMSTRCPAHVKRTPLTGGEGTRVCFTRPGDPPPPARARRPRGRLARRLRLPVRLAAGRLAAEPRRRGGGALGRAEPEARSRPGARPPWRRARARDLRAPSTAPSGRRRSASAAARRARPASACSASTPFRTARRERRVRSPDSRRRVVGIASSS